MTPAQDAELARVLSIAASLAQRGFLRCVGFWPDGNPKYELTDRGHRALAANTESAG